MARWSLGEPILVVSLEVPLVHPEEWQAQQKHHGPPNAAEGGTCETFTVLEQPTQTQLPTLRNVPHEMETTAQTRQQRNTGVSGRGGSPTGKNPRNFTHDWWWGGAVHIDHAPMEQTGRREVMKTWKIRPMTDCEGHCNPQEEKDRARHVTWNAWWQHGSLPCRLVQKTWAFHPSTLRNPLEGWTLAADRTWTTQVYQKLGRTATLKEFVGVFVFKVR